MENSKNVLKLTVSINYVYNVLKRLLVVDITNVQFVKLKNGFILFQNQNRIEFILVNK